MVFGTGMDVAIGVFLALALSQYAGLVKKAEKAFKWIGAGAVALVLASVFQETPIVSAYVTMQSTNYGYVAFGVVGWVLVFVGTLWALYQLLVE
jgi:hypothetical protein